MSVITQVLTARDDRDEMACGSAAAAETLCLKNDFCRSDISIKINLLECDCGGRLDRWNVNKLPPAVSVLNPKGRQGKSDEEEPINIQPASTHILINDG